MAGKVEKILIPNIGDAAEVDVIEVMVKTGDSVTEEQSLITLEGDKATMEIPSPKAGIVKEVTIKVGDKVSEGSLILTLQLESDAGIVDEKHEDSVSQKNDSEEKIEKKSAQETAVEKKAVSAETSVPVESKSNNFGSVQKSSMIYAGPAVRRIAAELDIDLSTIQGSGPKGRIIKDDLKKILNAGHVSAGMTIAPLAKVDFSQYGEVEVMPLSKIQKISGANLHRNWVSIPHVTQFDKSDITDMEAFRKAQQVEAEKHGVKLTPLVFIMKAVVKSLCAHPTFNASLDSSGQQLTLKKYFHIGVAVDTPNGLVVPVIRDVDKKTLFELALELANISQKAREKGLTIAQMQGGCFSISSLGGIGGTAFTPIINAPEVAILGVSKAQIEPVYMGDTFKPRLMLPLSLSYDHRVIDGAEAARFITHLSGQLNDIRRLLL